MRDDIPEDISLISDRSASDRNEGTPLRTAAGPCWPAGGAPDGLLDLVDQAVVMCDASDVVRGFNRPAAEMFPQLRLGRALSGPMASAAARKAERFDCDVAGRRLSGHRRLCDGYVVWLMRDVSGAREDQRSLSEERERSAFLEQAGARLGRSLHHGRTVRSLAQAALPVLADAAVVVHPVIGRLCAWHRAGPERVEASGDVSAETLQRIPRIADALSGGRRRTTPFPQDELGEAGALVPPELRRGGEALAIPLSGNGVSAGALILVRGPERAGFSEPDVELAYQFAARAGLALATAALYSQQAGTTAVLQANLAPEPLPDVDAIVLGAAYRPAAEALRIGGDFYHVAPEPDGGVTFFFGDVCGKGAEAAALAGQVRQSLRTLALVESEPLRTLCLLNQALLGVGSRFTTLVAGSARPTSDGGLAVVTAGGGHLPPLVLRCDGRVEEVEVDGMLVGVLPDAVFGLTESRLGPGELMLLYSDGVTEARGGPTGDALYGEERLARDLSTWRGMPAGAVTERVELLTTQWLAGRPHDDIAVLAIQAPPDRRREDVR